MFKNTFLFIEKRNVFAVNSLEWDFKVVMPPILVRNFF